MKKNYLFTHVKNLAPERHRSHRLLVLAGCIVAFASPWFFPKQAYARDQRQSFDKRAYQSQSLLSLNAAPVPVTIRGKVTDANGQGLPGVSVVLKGTTIGTATDADGQYALSVPDEQTILVFSFIGYTTEEVPVQNRTVIDISLLPDIKALSEVVVVGYGEQKKSDITGAVSSVTADAYKDQPVVNVSSALQGRAAGVSISNSSGAPGGDVKIRIRGSNSINASNDPLYVVDGVALASISLQDINVNDIESMEVLKDASATAIYGSRGANGVILITTKSGKEGTMQVAYNTFVSIGNPMKKYDLLNPVDYAKLGNHIEGKDVFANPESLAGTGTDWQGQLFQTAITQNHQLSLSGGTEKSRYYLSGYYVNQTGTLINTGLTKFALRSNIDSKLSKKVSVGLNLFASRTNAHNTGDVGYKGNPIMSTLAWGPTERIYDDVATGQYNSYTSSPTWANPYMIARERNGDGTATSAVVNGTLKYVITDWLTLSVNAGLNASFYKTAYLNNKWISPGNEGAGQGLNENYTWQNSNILTFHKTLADIHDLTVTGVVEETANTYSYFGANGSGLASSANGYHNLALNKSQSIGSFYSNWALLSYVGRLSYTLKDKYLFTATYRADGSSKFQKTNNKWGYFPSAAIGWRLSEEPFIKDLNVFSNLKVRGSWGITGNQAIDPYSSLGLLSGSKYSFGTSTLYQGYSLGNPANPDLKWETTTQTDIGLEMSFLDNRINLTADYFNKTTKDLLLQVPIANYDGGGSVLQNIGKVQNKGFEWVLEVVPVRTADFTWKAAFNATTYTNKVLSLGKDTLLYRSYVGAGLINTSIQVVKTGESLGSFYLIPWTGLYQNDDNTLGYKAGDNRYQDVNHNGTIGYEDRILAGNARPKFQWGFNNNFTYKKFDLNLFIQGSHGNKIFNATYAAIAAPNSDVKYPTLAEASNYWTLQNTGATWADPASKTNRNYVESTHYLQDGSYVRLKNVSLSYTFPKELLRLVSIRLSASAQNLITLTKYKGYDPEATSVGTSGASSDADAGIDLGAYPSPHTFTFGLNATF